jgi:hypothetical protein
MTLAGQRAREPDLDQGPQGHRRTESDQDRQRDGAVTYLAQDQRQDHWSANPRYGLAYEGHFTPSHFLGLSQVCGSSPIRGNRLDR